MSPPLHLLVFLSLLCNSFSTCYYFQLKIKIHTQCLGVLAFLFLFSLILRFSIETKQRKGRLLNDENKGNISLSLFFFFFQNLEIWFRFWYCGLIGFIVLFVTYLHAQSWIQENPVGLYLKYNTISIIQNLTQVNSCIVAIETSFGIDKPSIGISKSGGMLNFDYHMLNCFFTS